MQSAPSGDAVIKEALNKFFDKLRTNGKLLITFMVSLSNHGRNQLVQSFLNAWKNKPSRRLENKRYNI